MYVGVYKGRSGLQDKIGAVFFICGQSKFHRESYAV